MAWPRVVKGSVTPRIAPKDRRPKKLASSGLSAVSMTTGSRAMAQKDQQPQQHPGVLPPPAGNHRRGNERESNHADGMGHEQGPDSPAPHPNKPPGNDHRGTDLDRTGENHPAHTVGEIKGDGNGRPRQGDSGKPEDKDAEPQYQARTVTVDQPADQRRHARGRQPAKAGRAGDEGTAPSQVLRQRVDEDRERQAGGGIPDHLRSPRREQHHPPIEKRGPRRQGHARITRATPAVPQPPGRAASEEVRWTSLYIGRARIALECCRRGRGRCRCRWRAPSRCLGRAVWW